MRKELKGLDGKVAIHCPTVGLYEQVCTILHEGGEKWCDNQSFLVKNTKWNSDKDQFCLGNIEGWGYADVDFFKSEECDIINASDFIALNTDQPEVIMRHEVIKLTDEAIFGQLIALLIRKGEIFFDGERMAEYDVLLFEGRHWTQGDSSYYAPTITDVDFLQKYGNTDQPDKEPAWTFKTDNDLADLIGRYEREKYAMSIFDFLTSIRTPAFSLQCCDGVVTNPDAMVFSILENDILNCRAEWARKHVDAPKLNLFISEQAALTHRLHNTPAIKLSDLEWDGEYYVIDYHKAHRLVNERINGTK